MDIKQVEQQAPPKRTTFNWVEVYARLKLNVPANLLIREVQKMHVPDGQCALPIPQELTIPTVLRAFHDARVDLYWGDEPLNPWSQGLPEIKMLRTASQGAYIVLVDSGSEPNGPTLETYSASTLLGMHVDSTMFLEELLFMFAHRCSFVFHNCFINSGFVHIMQARSWRFMLGACSHNFNFIWCFLWHQLTLSQTNNSLIVVAEKTKVAF